MITVRGITHKLQAIAGYSFSEESSESYDQMNYKFDTDIFGFHNIGSGGCTGGRASSMSAIIRRF